MPTPETTPGRPPVAPMTRKPWRLPAKKASASPRSEASLALKPAVSRAESRQLWSPTSWLGSWGALRGVCPGSGRKGQESPGAATTWCAGSAALLRGGGQTLLRKRSPKCGIALRAREEGGDPARQCQGSAEAGAFDVAVSRVYGHGHLFSLLVFGTGCGPVRYPAHDSPARPHRRPAR